MSRKPTGAPRGNPAWRKDPETGKGVSGNPGGKRSTPLEVRRFIEEHSMAAAEALVRLATDQEAEVDSKVRLAAIKCVLEWGLGKPATVDPNGDVVRENVVNVTVPDRSKVG